MFSINPRLFVFFLRSIFLYALSLAIAPTMPVHAQPAHSVAAANPHPAAEETAKRWLLGIYANLRAHGPAGATAMRGKDLYAPSLLALFSENQKAHGPNEVPYLDGDIFCDCQEIDVHDVHIDLHPLEQADPARTACWEARVSFRNFDEKRIVRLILQRTSAGWRIFDAYGVAGKSLRVGLRRDTRERIEEGRHGN